MAIGHLYWKEHSSNPTSLRYFTSEYHPAIPETRYMIVSCLYHDEAAVVFTNGTLAVGCSGWHQAGNANLRESSCCASPNSKEVPYLLIPFRLRCRPPPTKTCGAEDEATFHNKKLQGRFLSIIARYANSIFALETQLRTRR